MRYRAIVAIKKSSDTEGKKKAERESIEIQLMKELLKFWDSSNKVLPYYVPNYDADKEYSRLMSTRYKTIPEDVNIDDPLSVMNWFGAPQHLVFYTEIPDFDRKNRNYKKREYEEQIERYKKSHKKIPDDIRDRYKYDLIEPKCSPKTKLYTYSTANPNGMFSTYCFPIEHGYIPDIPDIDASKLLNRNYGTMHDILLFGDLDFEGTYLPNVIFRNDGEILESYPESEDDINIGGDPEEIREFLEETMERDDYVAIIECEV